MIGKEPKRGPEASQGRGWATRGCVGPQAFGERALQIGQVRRPRLGGTLPELAEIHGRGRAEQRSESPRQPASPDGDGTEMQLAGVAQPEKRLLRESATWRCGARTR